MSEPISGGVQPGDKAGDYRLPTDVYPKHYDLAIKTNLHTSPPSFSGEVLVHLDIKSDTSSLVFNVHPSLTVSHAAITTTELKSTSAVVLPSSALSVNEEQERGTIDLAQLPGGGLKSGAQAKVWMRFEGELKGNMVGYYKSEGDADEAGKKDIYALTQFEPTAARKAFPCWDEPLLKSTFSVSLIGQDQCTLLANMPEVSSKPWKAGSASASPESALAEGYEIGSLLGLSSPSSGKTEGNTEGKTEGKTEEKTEGKTEGKTEPSGEAGAAGWKIAKFEKTPPVSTYLVAYACGEFAELHSEHKSKLTGKTVPLRIFATKDQIKQAQFGLDIKKWALPVYEEIFDIPYALPKLDTLVAHDFDAGAELGLDYWSHDGVLIRPREELFGRQEASGHGAVSRAGPHVVWRHCHHEVVGQSLAQRGFWCVIEKGNADEATLMGELVIPDRIWPEWKVRAEFLNSHLTSALALDSQRSSHPIEVDCPDANQINQIFDSISYSKGASVLRMIAAVVGEDKFLKGVSIYLKKHLYGNAETKDLWNGVSEASGLDVAEIMANWTLKVGFPVITVEELDGKLRLTQNRFLSTGDVKPEEDETIWWVPLEVKTLDGGKASVDHKAVLNARSIEYPLTASSFKLNAETVGVYRVKYSPERLTTLGNEAQSYSVEDRVGLVSDATTLARAGYAKTSGSLNLVAALGKDEREFLPWSQIGLALGKLSAAWWEQPEPVRNALEKLRRDLFTPIVERMGYEHSPDDAPDVKELRELAVSTSAAAEDPAVLAELKERFAPFLKDGDDSRIPPDLQRSIYTNATRHGGVEEYERILKVYNKPPNPSTKVDAMYALCATRDEALIERTFGMLADGSVKDQDLYIFCFGLAGNKHARRKTAKWFMDNYDDLYKRFGDSYGISYLVKGSFNSLTSYKDLEEIKAFFKDKDVRKFRLAVSQTFDSVQASADWLERDLRDVEQWLKDNKYL